jgi:hypothetical protein
MKNITTDELRRMTGSEGLVLQGCGGDSQEWLNGINELLTEASILLGGSTFKDAYSFEHEGLTNLLFDFDGVELDVGKLAIWRLRTHEQFGGTWLSDYVPNRLGGYLGKESEPQLTSTNERSSANVGETLIKIENTDLSVAVLQMQALSGGSILIAAADIQAIARTDEDYLLLATKNGILLSDAEHAYRIDTSSSPEAKAFALIVKSKENGCAFGDIFQIDPEDMGRFAECLSGLRTSNDNYHKAVTSEDFLVKINAGYMNAAENPQEDMLRVTPEAALELLARDDASVYRLLPSGIEWLTQMDAVRNVARNSAGNEFAIYIEDLPGLAQWAERKATRIISKVSEPAAPDKSKKHTETER